MHSGLVVKCGQMPRSSKIFQDFWLHSLPMLCVFMVNFGAHKQTTQTFHPVAEDNGTLHYRYWVILHVC